MVGGCIRDGWSDGGWYGVMGWSDVCVAVCIGMEVEVEEVELRLREGGREVEVARRR